MVYSRVWQRDTAPFKKVKQEILHYQSNDTSFDSASFRFINKILSIKYQVYLDHIRPIASTNSNREEALRLLLEVGTNGLSGEKLLPVTIFITLVIKSPYEKIRYYILALLFDRANANAHGKSRNRLRRFFAEIIIRGVCRAVLKFREFNYHLNSTLFSSTRIAFKAIFIRMRTKPRIFLSFQDDDGQWTPVSPVDGSKVGFISLTKLSSVENRIRSRAVSLFAFVCVRWRWYFSLLYCCKY
jgi:hypothetical protein